MRSSKFRALVTIDPAALGAEESDPLDQKRTMALRACHHGTHCNRVFSAVVAPDDDGPRDNGDPHRIVTVLLVDDAAKEYLGPGDHFDLWLGGPVGHGIVSRQVIPSW